MTFRRTRTFSIRAAAIALLALPAVAAEVPDPLPDPDGKPADMTKPVQVYILMGQSNMLGFGKVGPAEKEGTLEYAIKTKGKYPNVIDDAGTRRNLVVNAARAGCYLPQLVADRNVGVVL